MKRFRIRTSADNVNRALNASYGHLDFAYPRTSEVQVQRELDEIAARAAVIQATHPATRQQNPPTETPESPKQMVGRGVLPHGAALTALGVCAFFGAVLLIPILHSDAFGVALIMAIQGAAAGLFALGNIMRLTGSRHEKVVKGAAEASRRRNARDITRT